MPALIEAIAPRWIVPMHYLTPRINLKIQPVERFLDILAGWAVEWPGKAVFEPDGPSRIVVLDHAR